MRRIDCGVCGTPVITNRATTKYCSPACLSRSRRPRTRPCARCGGPAPTHRGRNSICDECKRPVHLKVIQVHGCRHCAAPISGAGARIYCTAACRSEAAEASKWRACSRCGGEWRLTDRTRRSGETACWPCRSIGFVPGGRVYEDVKEHRKAQLVRREDGRCEDCAATAEDVGEPLHAHHIDLQSAGGSNALANLKLLCPDCHLGSGYERNHPTLAAAGFVAPLAA